MSEALAQAGRYLTEPHAQVVRPGDGDHDGPEDNPRAAMILGKRADDVDAPGVLVINLPCEEGYRCPECDDPEGPAIDWESDERLAWSEYRSMLWCYVCERDYPSALCLAHDPVRATEVFLNSIEHTVERSVVAEHDLRGALGLIERWCRAIGDKAENQGSADLAATAPHVAGEIARALAGRPLEYAVDAPASTLDLVAFLDVAHANGVTKYPAPDGAAPLDRATRWAHELAEVARALDDAPTTGRYAESEPGMPLHDRVYDVMAEQREIGELEAVAAISPEVLFRAIYPEPRPDEETGARRRLAEAVRGRLAAELGWTS